MKDSVSTYCHFWASGGESVNGNKHNNRASPHAPQNIHRTTPPSQVPGLASTFGDERGTMVELWQLFWDEGWRQGPPEGQKYLGVAQRELSHHGCGPRYRWVKFAHVEDSPSSSSPSPRQPTCTQPSIQRLPPCQMRDDLDVDKIFVLSWL